MHWIVGLIGAFLGASLGNASTGVLGMLLGFIVGWQAVRLGQLRAQLQSLEQRVARRGEPAQAEATPPPPATEWPTAASAEPARASTSQGSDSATPSEQAAAEESEQAAPWPRRPSVDQPAKRPEPAAAYTRSTLDDNQRSTQPQEDELATRIGATLKRWLLEGNVPVKLGSLVLFIGVAAALKFAADQGLLNAPIELRLAAIGAGGLALLGWGWRRRMLQPAFGLSLQGAGLGILLLTVFTSFRVYELMPAGIAFALVLLLVAGAAALALLQNAMALAVLGFIGGYLAPVLIATGTGNHVVLFSYYAVLNTAVFAIAWVRPWRVLNLVGFSFTFAITAFWGWSLYQPQYFASVEPFLVLFFLFYTAIPLLYALRQPQAKRGVVDGTLVFGTPLLAFSMQAGLLRGQPMALAFSALAVAALYAVLAWWLIRKRNIELLGQSYAMLAVGFATLAVPLALSARWTSAVWALEGAALIWLGLRQNRRLPQFAGWLLQALAALAYLNSLLRNAWRPGSEELLLLNGHALGLLMMAIAGLSISRLYERHEKRHPWLLWPPFLAGLMWWSLGAFREITMHLSDAWQLPGLLAFAAISAALAGLLRQRLPWPRLGWAVLAAAMLSTILALSTSAPGYGALQWPDALVWCALFAALAFGLHSLREPQQRGISLAHVATLWSLALAVGLGLLQLTRDHPQWALGSGWQLPALALPLSLLMLGTMRRPSLFAWPLSAVFSAYSARWHGPASLLLVVLFLISLYSSGDPAPLPYVPLLNPLELFQLALLLASARLALQVYPSGDSREGLRFLWPIAALLFLSFAGLRGVHHLADVPWTPAILEYAVAQATLTLLWSIAGVSAWILGSRSQRWSLWLSGAILMGLVLAKLILVDRTHMGDVAGIVSFMAVGALLVLVGRIAPTPPRPGTEP